MQEVPEDRLQVETLRPAHFRVLGRDQTSEVDDEVRLQRCVLEQYAITMRASASRFSSSSIRTSSVETSRTSRSGGSFRDNTTSAMRSTSAALFVAYGMLVISTF